METSGIVPISKNVVQMMQNRLEEAESAATQLTMEIHSANETNTTECFSVLLSKVRSMETVLQSLKLNFVNLSTLTRQPSDMEQKLVEMTEIYTDEIKKLSNEIHHLSKDKQEMLERQTHIEIDMQRLKVALEESLTHQSMAEEGLIKERSRIEELNKHISETDKLLTEERRLRFTLDKANMDLGQRLDEMESLLKQEQIETQSFTSDFVKMKKELSKRSEEVIHEKERQQGMANELSIICGELESKTLEVKNLKKENTTITGEMGKVHEQYNNLNGQLEAMQKLFNDFQSERKNIESDCEKLKQTVNLLTEENKELTAEVVRVKNDDESAKLIQTRQNLRKVQKTNEALRADNEALAIQGHDLEDTVKGMEVELSECKLKSDKAAEFSMATIEGLQGRLSTLKEELEGLEGEKTNLLSEVNGAVDAMETERNSLQQEVQSYQQQLTIALDELEEEKVLSNKLQKKLDALSHDKPEFTHFDRRLAELTEQKNALSYENGKLQSKCDQLQENLSVARTTQEETTKLSRKLTAAESKVKKLKRELESCQQSLKHSEVMSQQLQTSSELRESDYKAAISSRDQALNDAKSLAERVESLEEALQTQEEIRSEVEQTLREDNSKVAESLEGMMALHTELQCKHENLHIDLGKKDTELRELKNEKKRWQTKLTEAEKELAKTSGKLNENEAKQNAQHKNIEQELKGVKLDNTKLVKTLQDTLEVNEQLRSQVSVTEDALVKLRNDCNKHKTTKLEVENKFKLAESAHAACVIDLETQVRRERDRAYERMDDQLKTVQKETETILERNSELLKANSDLKNLLSDCDKERQSIEVKMSSLQEKLTKTQESLKYKTRQSAKLKELTKELGQLETDNRVLEAKCDTQQETINKFVSQFQELQVEMKQLVSLHSEQAEQLSEKERLLQAEEMKCKELREKYHQTKKQVGTLQALQKHTETQLMEANNDTVIAATTLEDTNRYFKEKFSALSSELSSAKKRQMDLEWRNLEKQHQLVLEKNKLDDTTRKAKEMMKASRHALTKIADDAELANTTYFSDQTYSSTLSPRRFQSTTQDVSIDSMLCSSALRNTPDKTDTLRGEAPSPFTSSSQKLDAIISEMERRRLIT